MCNFDCAFCRYANHKQNTGIINVDTIKKILRESAEINADTNPKVKVLFHGGEPLLWGIERFYEIYEYEKELSNKTGVKFVNSIQTNASLIDDASTTHGHILMEWPGLVSIEDNVCCLKCCRPG